MSYTQTAAIARAKSWVGRLYPAGWCQKWVVIEIFNSGGVGDWDGDGAADAEDGWKSAKRKVATSDPGSIPAGYPIYFLGGSRDHGHAAVSAGGGYMYSTDLPTSGKVGKVLIRQAESSWGVKLAGYVIEDKYGHVFTDAGSSTPKPVRHESSVLIQNCASKRSDVGAGSWAKRRQILADIILQSNASFIICPELYSLQRPWMTSAISARYAVAGYREGRVLYYRRGRWSTASGWLWRNLLNGLRKPCVVDSFKNVENGTSLTVSAWHTSYETTADGSRKRRLEVATGIKWIKSLGLPGRKIYAGDFNSPADRTTRTDDVEPVFEAYGYHDLEDDHEVANGPGHYHLERVFAGEGVKGEDIEVVVHRGSDHPATFVKFSY